MEEDGGFTGDRGGRNEVVTERESEAHGVVGELGRGFGGVGEFAQRVAQSAGGFAAGHGVRDSRLGCDADPGNRLITIPLEKLLPTRTCFKRRRAYQYGLAGTGGSSTGGRGAETVRVMGEALDSGLI